MKTLTFSLLTTAIIMILGACGNPTTTNNATPSNSSSSSDSSTTSETKSETPVEITIGGGFASEESLWLMLADQSYAPNMGKKYTIKYEQFRANADRFNAYRAGKLDGGIIGQGATMQAMSQGVDLTVVGTILKDSPDEGFNNTFMSAKDSGIKSASDLKGKIIGIPDFKSPTDMWARSAVRSAGLDPDKDVKYAVMPIPAMAEGVKSGKIDVGMFPQPFYLQAKQSGEFQEVFTSKTGVPVEEDFLVLFFNPEFLEKNREAVQAFIDDLKAATKYYVENPKEARQVLLDAKMVLTDPALFLELEDNKRPIDLGINMEGWEKVQDILLQEEWLSKEVDLNKLIDTSFIE